MLVDPMDGGTLWLFDPCGESGWTTDGRPSADVWSLLCKLGSVGLVGNAFTFKVKVMSLRLQTDGFQCGVWCLVIAILFCEWRSAVQACTESRGWVEYATAHLLAKGVHNLRPREVGGGRVNSNQAFIAERRSALRPYCTNPRGSLEPQLGVVSEQVRYCISAHYYVDERGEATIKLMLERWSNCWPGDPVFTNHDHCWLPCQNNPNCTKDYLECCCPASHRDALRAAAATSHAALYALYLEAQADLASTPRVANHHHHQQQHPAPAPPPHAARSFSNIVSNQSRYVVTSKEQAQ